MSKKKRNRDALRELEQSLQEATAPQGVTGSALDTATEAPQSLKQLERAEKRRLKKLRRAEKKEARRKKKEEKKNRYVLYDPAKMQGFTFSLPLGYFLRFFSIGFSLFGVLWLFCDAFATAW